MQTGTEPISSGGRRIAGRLAGGSSVFAPASSPRDAYQSAGAEAASAPWVPTGTGSGQGDQPELGVGVPLSPGDVNLPMG